MQVIIIAAGRGRRLMPTTADAPKCFAEVNGRRLLDWAVAAFAGAGVTDLCFIGGYQIEKVRREYPRFTFCHNAGWEQNNILLSLMHAEDLNVQEMSVQCFTDLVDENKEQNSRNTSYYEYTRGYAKQHYTIIERFGRFPHRNIILDRVSTQEELEFLKKHSGF